MILGYNTNGLAHHRLLEALELCAQLGYGGVAITVDVGHLDPMGDWHAEAQGVRERARDLGLALAVETGARFVLDKEHKHLPNLMSASPSDAARRLDFYERCIRIAQAIGAPLISLWSGALSGGERLSEPQAWERLAGRLAPLLVFAEAHGVRVAMEPEPGMFLETPDQYLALKATGGSDLANLGLTLDVGHCLVTGGETPQAALLRMREELLHVHLDDIAGGVHEHRMFGEGDLDWPAVARSLKDIEFQGMAAVELSRDSYRGAQAAKQAFQFLKQA